MKQKTSAMVEAGILSAIAIVFAMISMYVPVIGMFINFIWSLPIAICGARNGLRWSIMTLIVAGSIISILISPIHALSLVAVFGILGVVLGECLKRKLEPMRIMGFGSIAAFISLMLSLLISFFLMGINPLEMFFNTFDKAIVDSVEFYKSQGMSAEQIEEATKSTKDLFRMVKVIMPGAFIVCAPLITLVNYLASKAVLGKLGEHFAGFPPFTRWDLPRWTLIPYGVSLLLVTQYLDRPEHILYTIGVNIQMMTSLVFVLQGISLIYWFVEHNNKPKWWRNVAIALIFLNQFVSQVICLLGAFDLVFDFRKLRPIPKK